MSEKTVYHKGDQNTKDCARKHLQRRVTDKFLEFVFHADIFSHVRESSIISFSTLAWIPVSLLTPMASYITTMAKKDAIANSKLSLPYWRQVEVASAQTVDEWELGMPPLPTIRSATKLLVSAVWIMVFKICARNQPSAAAIKISFAQIPLKKFIFSSGVFSVLDLKPIWSVCLKLFPVYYDFLQDSSLVIISVCLNILIMGQTSCQLEATTGILQKGMEKIL